MSDELYHHGKKGQKWGIRRGPPYPIEDTVLKKGTRLNSVSPNPDANEYKKSGKWVYTYNPNDEWDSKVYKGPFSRYRSNEGKKFLYEHQYEVVSDLKMPTREQRIDEFIKVYKNKFIPVRHELSMIQNYLRSQNVGSEDSRSVNVANLKTRKDYEAAYEIFNHMMEASYAFRSTSKYSELMSQKYDAMVDDNNQGIYNNTHDPVIIFRANRALKKIGDTKMVTFKEMWDNYYDVRTELAKEGKRVKL